MLSLMAKVHMAFSPPIVGGDKSHQDGNLSTLNHTGSGHFSTF